MPLSADDIDSIRIVIGDTELKNDGEYIITDSRIQQLYDKANGHETLAYIFMLRLVVGYYQNHINVSDIRMGENNQYSLLYEQARKSLMDYMKVYAEYSNTPLGTGVVEAVNGTDTAHTLEGMGGFSLQTDYYDIPLDHGQYELMKTRLDAIYGR